MTFQDLKLSSPLLRAVAAQGYPSPTPIQQSTIPPLLEGRDLIGCAQTGTGKTAAFALPILQNLSNTKGRGIRALILTPTRELAIQILENFQNYGTFLRLRTAAIFGGVSQVPQVAQLQRGVDILVATPGRLMDLMQQKLIDLSSLQIFVLDEADRMLDMGFIHDVRRIIAALPPKRQTLLYSATMSPEIEGLAKGLLHNPLTVKVDPVTSTVAAIDQCLYFIDKKNKPLLLAQLLSQENVSSALVFTRTKHGANNVVKDLDKAGIEAMAIHGNKSQTARQTALTRFKSGSLRVLIATDIAARGIDVPELSHVINYDLPNEPETYIHRIGRTGRAGMDGIAVSFCCVDELDYLKSIQRLTGCEIPVKESPWPMVVTTKTEKAPNRSRRAAPRPAAEPKQTAKAAQPRKASGSALQQSAPAKPALQPRKDSGSTSAKSAPKASQGRKTRSSGPQQPGPRKQGTKAPQGRRNSSSAASGGQHRRSGHTGYSK